MSRGKRDGRKYWINFRSLGIPFIQLIFVDTGRVPTAEILPKLATLPIFGVHGEFASSSSVVRLENSRADRYHQNQLNKSHSKLLGILSKLVREKKISNLRWNKFMPILSIHFKILNSGNLYCIEVDTNVLKAKPN